MAADMNEPVGSGESQTQSLIDAFKSGQVNLGGSPDTSTDEDNSAEEVSQEETGNIVDQWEAANQETESESSEELSADSDSEDSQEDSKEATAEKESGDIEELVVTGDKGRRKVKVDFSDRDKLKKHVQLAYGARKWQKERDDARSQLSSVREEFDSLKSDWEKLEAAYESKGVAGLVNLLEGRDGAYEEFRKQELEREQRFQSMSDDERAAYDRDQELEKERQRSQQLQDEYDRKLKEIQEQQDVASMRALESKIHPSFDRYRFKGKLGDSIAETEFDEMLWNRALSSLEKIGDENVELTQGMIDKEFRRIANTIKKHLNSQVDKTLKKTISKKKQDAAKKVKATVSKSMKSSQEVESFRNSMKSGNFVDGLTSFFKAGGKLK